MSTGGEQLLRMREVCARTGLARSTIHHYLREGLLPKPRKTGRNTALYDQEFVRRVQLVKRVQDTTHLPLARIRALLEGMPDAAIEGIDPERFSDVTHTIAARLRLASERDVSRTELLAMSGLEAADLNGLARAGLIEEVKRGKTTRYAPVDVRVVLAFARIRAAGATAERGFVGTPGIVEAYRKHLTALARIEAREMVRMMGSLADMDVDAFVAELTEPLSDLIAALHRKALVQALTEMTED